MATERRTRQVTDPLAMRALAHPLRLRLLRLVRDRHPVTGAELAAVVGESSASVSYHLSILARHGFIEPDPAAAQSRRHKPWRATYESDSVVAGATTGPIAETAEGALLLAMLTEGRREVDTFLARHQDLPQAWRETAAFLSSSVVLLPAEVDEVADAVRALLDRYDRRGAPDLPADARRVSVSFIAVPDLPAVPDRPDRPDRPEESAR
jgi:DNA-binding transcriptional ArsR family regulator